MTAVRSLLFACAALTALTAPVLAQEGLGPDDLPPLEGLTLEDLPPEEDAPEPEFDAAPEPAPADPAADPFAADSPFQTADLADPDDDFLMVIQGERAVLRGLNKVTAQTEDFTVPFDEPLEFGSLTVLVRYCSRRPPELIPETFVFMEVYDRTFDGAETTEYGQKIFGGWMLGSSPGLHGLEHPVYDIWPVGCIAPGDDALAAEVAAEAAAAAAEQAANDAAAAEAADEVFLD